MSSMRNAVQRRNHKERAQPLEREKWGLLEKRKYVLRLQGDWGICTGLMSMAWQGLQAPRGKPPREEGEAEAAQAESAGEESG
jgi:hypothetical protein